MGFGFELRDASGNLSMDTESFGLLLADSFEVNYNATGSTTYPNLAWSNVVVPTQTMQIDGTVYSRSLSSYGFLNFTITRDASNIPTVSWSPGASSSSGLGGDNNDTSNASLSQGSNGIDDCLNKVLSFGGDKRPRVSVSVFVG